MKRLISLNLEKKTLEELKILSKEIEKGIQQLSEEKREVESRILELNIEPIITQTNNYKHLAIDSEIAKEVKDRAKKEDKTIKQFVEEILIEELKNFEQIRKKKIN